VGPEVLFHDGVYTLGLAVSFRVEGGAQAAIDAKPVAESTPESGGELRASVGDYGVGQAMEAEHMLDEHICKVSGINVVPAGDQVTSLGQAIDYYPYGIVPV
jgi:hypothetical protein